MLNLHAAQMKWKMGSWHILQELCDFSFDKTQYKFFNKKRFETKMLA